MLVSTSVRKIRRWLGAPASCFVLVACLIGVAAALLNPAFGGYDEADHFLRAWQISEGELIADVGPGAVGEPTHGSRQPAELPRDIARLKFSSVGNPGEAGKAFEYLGASPPGGETMFIGFPATASYSPVAYMGAAGGIRISRWLNLSTLAALWAARLGGLGLYVAIIVRAMRHLPGSAWLIGALAVTPVGVLQAATVSADGVTIALCLLAIAYSLRIVMLDAASVVPRRLAIEGVLIATALGLAKPPYVLLLLIMVPVFLRRGSPNGKSVYVAVWAAGCAAATAWNLYARGVYTAPMRLSNVDSGRQLKFVALHIGEFVKAIVATVSDSGFRLGREMVWSTAAWIPPTWFLVVATSVIVGSLMFAGGTRTVGVQSVDGVTSRSLVLTTLCTTSLIGFFVFLFAYAGWNPVGASRVDEVQGRYLFPCVALVSLVVSRRNSRVAIGQVVPFCAIAAMSVFTVVGISVHYYI